MMAAVATPRCSATDEAAIKVRLQFRTCTPVHLRSHILETDFGAKPPFLEDVCIWVSPDNAYPRLSSYTAFFAMLKLSEIVPADADLCNYLILDEDTVTLAYHTED